MAEQAQVTFRVPEKPKWKFIDYWGIKEDVEFLLFDAPANAKTSTIELRGASGSGKTHLFRQLCYEKKFPVYSITGNPDMMFRDLVERQEAEGGSTIYHEGVLAQWLAQKAPAVLIVEEFQLIDRGIAASANSINDDVSLLELPTLKKTYKRTPEHYLLLTSNPVTHSYAGGSGFNVALNRRTNPIWLPVLPKEEVYKWLTARGLTHKISMRLAEFQDMLAKGVDTGQYVGVLGLPNLLRLGFLWEHTGKKPSSWHIYGYFPPNQHKSVEDLWGAVSRVKQSD